MRAPAAARFLVECYAHRVARPVLDDAELVMSELVTNSVRHSGGTREQHVIVRAELTDTALRLEVEDPGRRRVVAIRAARPGIAGGFGLNLVEQLSRSWGVQRPNGGGTTVWADVPRSPAAAPA
jgi:anti-sigma regulatory factor (Ser/Thr protein kinase)